MEKKVMLRTIKRLKEIRAENSLTIPQISEKLIKNNVFISEPTLKRLFSPNSEKMNFKYQDTIAPIAEILYAEYGESSPSDDPEELHSRLWDRDKMIEQLMIQIEEMKTKSSQYEKMCNERRTLLESHISDLQEEVSLLKSQIEKKDAMFERMMSALVLKDKE